ncbi:MAG TPA: SUMF1/EgtB/PvdO family nonheme iron enzyme, partial [Planctomycetota bacterium]|nr:SUMF1/EgtB/PvdO family nonheme iron enzyme [Planctomycetota bacterium]
ARAALRDARAKLGAYRELRLALEPRRRDLDRGAVRDRSTFVPPEEARAHAAAGDAVRADASRLESMFFAVLEDLNRARRHDATLAEIDATLVDAHGERWREAVAAGDETARTIHAARIRELDAKGRWRAALDGLGTLAVAGEPRGAEAQLFRYVPMNELVEGGDRRLVPVPFDPARGVVPTPGVVPGEVVLEIEAVEPGSPAEACGLRAGDYVARIDGEPIEGTLYAMREAVDASGNRALPMDRLTHFEGRAIRDYADVFSLTRMGGPRTVDVSLRRGSEEHPFEVALGATPESLEPAFQPSPAATMLASPIPTEGVALTVWSGGEAKEVWIEGGGRRPGLRTRTCAYPLFASRASRVGVLPAEPWTLPPGPYLVVLVRDGFETLRLPALVPREGAARVEGAMLPAASSPEGFVWIAPGAAHLGGDPAARNSRDEATVDVGGFWIARYELTMAEYVAFLSDPATDAEIRGELARTGKTIRIPRDPSLPQGAWRRDPDGGWSRMAVDLPINAVSMEDALAYVAWRNRKSQERGERWTYALPTHDQWEKAARGADARRYPWGDALQWHFCRALLSRPGAPFMEPGGSFPRDESPYGVRDLAGNLEEWVIDDPASIRIIGARGGNWWLGAPDAFAAAARTVGTPAFFHSGTGFRLVARLR